MNPIVQLELSVKRVSLVSGTNGESTWRELYVDCSPTDAFGILEIGDRYIFAARAKRSIFGKRKSCDLQISVKRRNSLTHENIEKIGLSDAKIGNLCFVPPVKGDSFWPSQRAALDAVVFVTDELFESLVSALVAGKRIDRIELDIEKPCTLEYGWEPDGSRKIWKLESTTDSSYVDVGRIDFGARLIEGRPFLYFFQRIADIVPGWLLWATIGFIALMVGRWVLFLLIRK